VTGDSNRESEETMADDKTQQARPPQQRGEQADQPQTRGESDSLIGEVIGGRYRVERQIGQGGMGVVYKAVQTGLEREVVVKVLSDERMGEETSIKRFEREAKSLSKIDHSNIVTIHDFGQEGDLGYIVMEYVDGHRLDQLIESSGGLALDTFGPIAVQILDAVGEAHRLGLIHRDLKPSNIMLTDRRGTDHFVKILDFGLAKLVSGATEVTADDSIVGSVPFLSPEQIKGDEVDQSVDVYALGIVFYYALTGRKPFQGTNASVLYDQVHNAPPPLHLHVQDPNRIPRSVTDLIEETLRKNPAERPPDATAFLDRLFEAVNPPERIAPPWMQSGDSSSNVRAQPAREPKGRESEPSADASQSGQQQAQDPARGSQDYLKAPPSTSDALKQVNTSQQPADAAPAREQSPGGRRAASASGSTATVDEDDGGTSVAWFGAAAGMAAVVAVGAFAVLSGQIDLQRLLGSDASTEASATGASDKSLPAAVESGIENVEALLAEGDVDGADDRLENLAERAPSSARWNQEQTRLQARIDARRKAQQGDRHIANDNPSRAETSYQQAAETLSNETLDWKLDNVRSLGVLQLEDLPDGTLMADGRELKRAKLPVVIPAGERTLKVVQDGESVWRADIDVGEDEETTIARSDGESTAGPEDDQAPETASSDDEGQSEQSGDRAGSGAPAEDEAPTGGADDGPSGERAPDEPTAAETETSEPETSESKSSPEGTGETEETGGGTTADQQAAGNGAAGASGDESDESPPQTDEEESSAADDESEESAGSASDDDGSSEDGPGLLPVE